MAPSSLVVFAQVSKPMGSARAKKEVQEQESVQGYACFLPMLTAQRKNKATPLDGESKEGHPHGSPQHQQLFGASETCKFKEEYR